VRCWMGRPSPSKYLGGGWPGCGIGSKHFPLMTLVSRIAAFGLTSAPRRAKEMLEMPEIIDEKPEIIDGELGEFPASKEGNGSGGESGNGHG
jgi:hypothetical protein